MNGSKRCVWRFGMQYILQINQAHLYLSDGMSTWIKWMNVARNFFQYPSVFMIYETLADDTFIFTSVELVWERTSKFVVIGTVHS
jgi:hypothetical protein